MLVQGKFLKVVPQDRSVFLNLSVSKVKTFKTCKAKYHFYYIQKLPRKEWDFQVFGKFLHEVLELFHGEIIQGNKDPDHILMKRSFGTALKEYSAGMTSDMQKECFDILIAYLKKRHTEKGQHPEVLEVEKEFLINIADDILLNGFIDVVQRDPDGVLHVADYKTSKHKKYLKNDFMQLKTYAYAMCLEDPSLEKVRCSYVMLRHGFDSILAEFTRDEVMAMESEFQEFAATIKKEKLFRPTPSPLCKFCDYLEKCDDGLEKMGMAKGDFGERDW